MSRNEDNPVTGNHDDSLRRLRAIRGGNRGTITKLERDAVNLMRNYGTEESSLTGDEIVLKITTISNALEEKLSCLKKLDEEILNKCPLEDIETEVEDSTGITTRVNETILKIKQFTKKIPASREDVEFQSRERQFMGQISSPHRISQHREMPASSPSRAGLNTSFSSSHGIMQVKLPKIQLPKFRGDITKFQSFWQSFKVAVDENEGLTKVHKLNYLITSLEGAAHKALEGLQMIEENYDKAVELLKTRFGRSQQVISAHMQELLNLQSFANEKAVNLRSIYDNILVHVRGLESLGVSSEKYGSLLIPVIMARMPAEVTLQVARKTSQDIWEIDEIMEIIRAEIEAREVIEKIHVRNKTGDRMAKPAVSTPVGTTKAFVAASESVKRPLKCFLCSKEHYASDCQEVMNIRKRIEILNAAKRCLCCLKTGHLAKNCQSNRKCRICKGKHHAIVCLKASKDEERTETDSSVTASAMKGKSNVLLQTAQTYAFGEDRSQKVPVNVLFDSGSQKTYVVERLRNLLKLKTEKVEKLNLNTFGTQNYVKKSCDRVVLNLELNDDYVPITALCHPAICSPVSSRIEVTQYPHLRGLDLANNVNCSNQPIDILIGADFYHDIVLGDVIKGDIGPVAVNSKLGWLLSGPVTSNDNVSCDNVISNLVLDIFPSKEETTDKDTEITESLQKFWKHESLGLTESRDDTDASPDESSAASKTKIEFSAKDNRYQVSLPWKENLDNSLPSDYDMCYNRVNSLYRKLKGKPDILQQYDSIFQDQLSKGIMKGFLWEKKRQKTLIFCAILALSEVTGKQPSFESCSMGPPSLIQLLCL